MSRRNVCWSDLQSELLNLIYDRLGCQTNTLNFRLVCKQWRASSAFSTHRNKNLLSPIFPYMFSINECTCKTPLDVTCPVLLAPCSIYLVRSSINSNLPPWLCTVEEVNPGKLYLCRGPRFGFETSRRSSIVPENFNASYYRLKEVGRFYTLRYAEKQGDIPRWCKHKFKDCKFVLIADPNCEKFPGVDDYNVIALIKGDGLQQITIKHGIVNNVTSLNNVRKYDDVVNFKGRIFAIDRKGRGYIMAYNERKLQIIVPQPVGTGIGTDRKKRLAVSSTGELYLVHGCPPDIKKGNFKLYKLNDDENEWDEVEGIGADRILIVPFDGCFFTMAKDCHGWKGNCIVFVKGVFPAYSDGVSYTSGFDIDVFHCGDGHYNSVDSRDCDLSLFWAFWPPPVWLTTDALLFNRESKARIEIMREHFRLQNQSQ